MSLTEVLPDIQSLSCLEKIRLIQILAQDLAYDEENLIEPGHSYPVWSPNSAFAAADELLKALDDEKNKS